MPLIRTALGSLSCQVLDEGEKPELLVVLCHGFGAPGDDLVSLGPELLRRHPELAGRVRFVFPAAPLSLDGFGFGDSRAWWLIDPERFGRLGDPRVVQELKHEIPEGLPRARRLLMAMVEELTRASGLPLSRVLLGGFSQGAMLATDLALRLEEAPAALAIFSGALISQEAWERLASRRRGLKVLQTHGTEDPLLPFSLAEELRELFSGAGLEVEFHSFRGGHTIAAAGVERLGALITTSLERIS